jgi:cyclophilin family peptidyl-prolyl cis-trans isomerase/HEAT repeat protein
MLADSTEAVRIDAAFALGELNDTSAIVIDALSRAARGNDSVAVEAMSSIGRLAVPSSYATVESVLEAAGTVAELRREVLLAVWHFSRRRNTLELLLPHTASLDAETRWRAVYSMTRNSADPRAVPYLIRLLADQEPLVRALAARGLRSATVDSANQRPQAIEALRMALADIDGHVRINAARALGSFHEPANASALAVLLHDEDGNVVLAATEALGDNGGSSAHLEPLIQSDTRIAVRNAALNSLLRVDRDRTLQIAAEWSNASEWLTRLYGVRVLAASRERSVIDRIRARVNDPDSRVAAAALQAVAVADTANPPYALYIEKLANSDPAVRAAALRGLQRRARPADLEVLLRAYERAQQDTQRTAILAAVDALGELARHNVPVQRSFFLRFHKPADPLVQQRIADRIGNGEWGALRPIDTQQPPEHYRAIARRFWHPDSVDSRPRVRIRTAPGEIVLELNPREAPLTVLNFLSLAERGYFNNGRWHRVVPNFVLQDGDPRGDGSGGPGTVIRDEINRLRYLRGALGMALSGPDTGGSQFFITHSPQPHLDGGYTIFGRVIEGMDIADRVVQDDPIISIEVVR